MNSVKKINYKTVGCAQSKLLFTGTSRISPNIQTM